MTSRRRRPNFISVKRTRAFRSADVETIRAKRPDVEVHVYPGAQHGFNCDERASYDKASSDIAWPRSLAFFAKHLKKSIWLNLSFRACATSATKHGITRMVTGARA